MNKKGQLGILLSAGAGLFFLYFLLGIGSLYVILQNQTLIALIVGMLVFLFIIKMLR